MTGLCWIAWHVCLIVFDAEKRSETLPKVIAVTLIMTSIYWFGLVIDRGIQRRDI